MASNIKQLTRFEPKKPTPRDYGTTSDSEDVAETDLRTVCHVESVHCVPVGRLCDILQINLSKGLTQAQVNVNRSRFGRNLYKRRKRSNPATRFCKCLFGPFEVLLWVSAMVCFLTSVVEQAATIGNPEENIQMGFLLIAIILLEGSLKFYQESHMQSRIKSFQNLLPEYATVIRNGCKVMVEISEVVVGDIVEIRAGDKVPADILVTKAQKFKVNNSSMTGESKPAIKISACTSTNSIETKNMVFFSTTVVDGSAQGIVVSVGEKTMMGEIVALTCGLPPRDTPLSRDMAHFVSVLSFMAISCGLICAAFSAGFHISPLDTFIFFIAILLANIPIGVACFIPMCLVICARRLANNDCLVKNLESVETLGSTTVICADKTGTLTQNTLTVSHLWFNDQIVTETSELVPDFNLDTSISSGFRILANVAVLCNNATVLPGQEDYSPDDQKYDGDAIDGAILKYIYHQGYGGRGVRDQYQSYFEVPFNPINKFHICVYKSIERYRQRGELYIVIKGAPEKIMAICDRIVLQDREYDLNYDWRDKIDTVCENFAKLGERTIAYCDVRLDAEDLGEDFDWSSNYFDVLSYGFRFIGLISLYDPPRIGVKESILTCRQAGIKVVMITGDHPITAKAVARKVGIITQGHQTVEEIAEENQISVRDVNPNSVDVIIINGTQLRYISHTTLCEILRNHQEIVFARMLPHQKLQIVDALQRSGEIVAVTGDGVNDAPALKKANIGIAMGKSGTEISKDSADLILMDDNFASLPYAIEQGRSILANLKKCCFIGLTDTTACVLSFIAYIFLEIPTPLQNMSMMLIALFLDFLPAISFAFSPPEKDELNQPPRDLIRNHMINQRLISSSYGQFGMIEALAGFFSYFVTFEFRGFPPSYILGAQKPWNSPAVQDFPDANGNEWTYSQRMDAGYEAATAFFLAVVLCQIINAINLGTRDSIITYRRLTKNWYLWGSLVINLCIVLLLLYTPIAGFIQLYPLSWYSWLLPVPFMMLIFCWGELVKVLVLQSRGGWIVEEFTI